MNQEESELVKSLMEALDAYQEEVSVKDKIIQEQKNRIDTLQNHIDQLTGMLQQILKP